MIVNTKLSPSVTISVEPIDSICPKAELSFTAEFNNAGDNPLYQWKKNNKNVGTNSKRYTDNNWKQGELVSCEITSSAECFIENKVSSNQIEVKVKNCNQ